MLEYRWHAVLLKHVREDREVRVVAQRARATGRHAGAHVREQCLDRFRTPLLAERGALQRRRELPVVKVRPVTRGTLLTIGHLALRSLLASIGGTDAHLRRNLGRMLRQQRKDTAQEHRATKSSELFHVVHLSRAAFQCGQVCLAKPARPPLRTRCTCRQRDADAPVTSCTHTAARC
jgi:hypothetical protein